MKQQAFIYTGIYALIMAITIVLIPGWTVADWRFFSWLHRGSALPISADVVIVDVPYHENLAVFRTEMSRLLSSFAEKPDNLPKLVVLDTWVAADTSGLSGLKKAVRQLSNADVPVYASIDLTREGKPEQLDPDYMDRHAQSFYDFIDGKGHTKFNHIASVIHYEPRLELSSSEQAGSQYVQALPVMIAMNHYNVPSTTKQVIVNLGDIEELRHRIYTFHHTENRASSFFSTYSGTGGSEPIQTVAPSFRGKLVVVGSLYKDRNKFKQLSGPEVLAFAISERILPKSGNRQPELLENPLLLFVMVVAFAYLLMLLFHFFYRKLPLLRSRLWLIAMLSMSAVLLLLVLSVLGFWLLNLVYTQVTLVAISIVVSTGVVWFSVLRDMEGKLIAPPSEKSGNDSVGLPVYDVFISYARTPENSAWVKAQVYEQLLKLRKPDGSPLRVFFDQRGIDPGENWVRKLALAIQGSRFFIPVYTADYFEEKTYRDLEMNRAAIRHVELGDFIIPIARDDVKVPAQYDHIQYLDVRMDPDFMERVAERIRKRDAVTMSDIQQ
jgi:hypothetical protein